MTRPPQLIDSPADVSPRAAQIRAAVWAVDDATPPRTRTRAPGRAPKAAAPARDPEEKPARSSGRVLRWVFARGTERLICELALADDDACYELRTSPRLRSAGRAVEHFADVGAAFRHQSALEGILVADGWTLDSYESLVVEPTPQA